MPTDLKPRVLTANIDLDEGTCSLVLLEAASEFFALGLPQARAIIKEVATVTSTWRDAANAVGARSAEINRMASAGRTRSSASRCSGGDSGLGGTGP